MSREVDFDRQLDRYASAAKPHRKTRSELLAILTPAVGAAAVLSSSAEGAIVPIDETPTFSASTGFANGFAEFDTYGNNDLALLLIGGPGGARVAVIPTFGAFFVATGSSNGAAVVPLSTGFTVGPTLTSGAFARAELFATGTYTGGGLANGSTALVGVRFPGIGGVDLYGWLEVSVDYSAPTVTFDVIQGYYEDSGASIQVGAIPEPSTFAMGSLGLLALGAAGVSHFRMKKSQEAKA